MSVEEIVKEIIAPKLAKIRREAKDDADRSRKIIDLYISDILRPSLGDPLQFDSGITDISRDGGLDAWAADLDNKRITLVQCKWYENDTNLSEDETLDLYNFVNHHLVPDERAGLNQDVKLFMGKYHAYWKGWKVLLIYITNAKLNSTARLSYDRLPVGFSFGVLDEFELAKQWYNALSQEVPIENYAIVAIRPKEYFITTFDVADSSLGDAHKVRVLQCVLSAKDLRDAYDKWARKLMIRNLRYGLGKGERGINTKMKATAESSERGAFYAFHNGISIVCNRFLELDFEDAAETTVQGIKAKYPELDESQVETLLLALTEDNSHKFVLLEDFQIVNGGQSTVTLADVKSEVLKDVYLPCKITETSSSEFANLIAIYNNTQNRILSEDLAANTSEQTFLQNYAAFELEPPVFYQRKRGEKWTDIFRVTKARPLKARTVTYHKTYTAFLAYMGNPGNAYGRSGDYINPDAPAYPRINEYARKDIILMSGLASNYERIIEFRRSDPTFSRYWIYWAIAAMGHIQRFHLEPRESENLTQLLLSDKGEKTWLSIRKPLITLFSDIFKKYFPKMDEHAYQYFFKNEDETFDLKKLVSIKPKDINPYLEPSVRQDSFTSMRRAQNELTDYSLSYYDVYFAVFAKMIDITVSSKPSILKDMAKITKGNRRST